MDVEEFVSKPEKGTRGRGRGRGKQSRLSLGTPVLSRASQRGCLNREELDHWSKNFALPDRELKACERAVNDCYKPHPLLGLVHIKKKDSSHRIQDSSFLNQTNTSTCSTPLSSSATHKYPLSLSKWVRWQTGQTHFKMVGPSEKRKQFVALLEFMDLMHSCEGMGESYSTEMATFLNEEDIVEVTGTAGSTEGRVERRVRVCKRRRLPSDSSDDDDDDFVEKSRRDAVRVVDEKANCLGETSDRGQTVGDDVVLDEVDTDEQHVSSPTPGVVVLPTPEVPPPCNNDRSSLAFSQHVIPRPPSCESLDWLDNIEPSQNSTPLPSSTKHRHSPQKATTSSNSFQFALPRTPPSTRRRSKTPFVSPLSAPLPPHRDQITPPHHTSTSGGSVDLVSDTHSACNVESMDLFADISSAVLFGDFSDINTSTNHKEMELGRPSKTEMESGRSSKSDQDASSVQLDPDIICIPDSGDEGEEGERTAGGGGTESRSEVQVSTSERSSHSEESLVVVRRKRAKCARPDFLLTQAPPSSDSDSLLGEVETEEKTRKDSSVTRGSDFSDDDDFAVPLRHVRRVCGQRARRDQWISHTVSHNPAENKGCDYFDKEAEVSGGESVEEATEEEGDCYDMEDSFINDNSILTQVQVYMGTVRQIEHLSLPTVGNAFRAGQRLWKRCPQTSLQSCQHGRCVPEIPNES